jgi:tRNA U55 pseudouridine synthase TruB
MDNLQYIREAIRLQGNRTQVKVVRWEINPVTGAQDTPYEVSVNAQIALRELQKPVNKRSYSWARIRPIGETHVGIKHKADQNSLSDPELLSKLKEELKAQLRAEMEAELAQSTATITEEVEQEDKPKRKRKVVIEEELNSLDSPELRVDDLPL